MARPKNHEAHITAAVGQLFGAVAALVESVGGAVEGVVATRGAAKQVGKAGRAVGHAVSTKGAKLAKAIKASWAKYTSAQRRARIAEDEGGAAKGLRGAVAGRRLDGTSFLRSENALV